MISYEEVESSLLEAEHSYDTSMSALNRMSPLYIAQIYAMLKQMQGIKAESARIQFESSSEFVQAVNGKSPESILPIMDDLMNAVKTMHPGMYKKIMERIIEA